jgi:hypothetical protein
MCSFMEVKQRIKNCSRPFYGVLEKQCERHGQKFGSSKAGFFTTLVFPRILCFMSRRFSLKKKLGVSKPPTVLISLQEAFSCVRRSRFIENDVNLNRYKKYKKKQWSDWCRFVSECNVEFCEKYERVKIVVLMQNRITANEKLFIRFFSRKCLYFI